MCETASLILMSVQKGKTFLAGRKRKLENLGQEIWVRENIVNQNRGHVLENVKESLRGGERREGTCFRHAWGKGFE